MAGMDASVVVQVFVEGTKAAVAAVSTKGAGADKAADVSEEVDAASVASALAQAGLDNSAPGAEKVAGPAGGSVSGGKRGGGVAPAGPHAVEAERERKKKVTSFEYVVIGISVAEDFPDGRLK